MELWTRLSLGVLVPAALLVLAGTGMSACGSDGKATLELDQTDPLPDGVSSDAVEDIPGTGDVTGKETAGPDTADDDVSTEDVTPPGCEAGETRKGGHLYPTLRLASGGLPSRFRLRGRPVRVHGVPAAYPTL